MRIMLTAMGFRARKCVVTPLLSFCDQSFFLLLLLVVAVDQIASRNDLKTTKDDHDGSVAYDATCRVPRNA